MVELAGSLVTNRDVAFGYGMNLIPARTGLVRAIAKILLLHGWSSIAVSAMAHMGRFLT